MYKHQINAYKQTHKRNKLWEALKLSRESDVDEKFGLQKAPREKSPYVRRIQFDWCGSLVFSIAL